MLRTLASSSGERQDAPAAAGFDAGFVRRVMRTTAVVGAIVAALGMVRFGVRVSLGLLTGAALGIGSLASIEWIVLRVVRPGGPGRNVMTMLTFAKIPLLALALWMVAGMARANLVAVTGVVAGVTLVPVVIFLKAVGIWMAASGGKERSDA